MKPAEKIQEMIDRINQEMDQILFNDNPPMTVGEIRSYLDKSALEMNTLKWIGEAFDEETYKMVSKALFETGDTGRMVGIVEALMWVIEQIPTLGFEEATK
jgi:hypothetical protein